MKKTLMALAVGAAFVAPAAFADVTISGAINMGIIYADSDDGKASAGNTVTGAVTPSSGGSFFALTSNYSNITISSVDDLGGGLKLDFAAQMEWGGPTDVINVAGGGILNRNSHIGLVGERWGGIWYGTNENLYERYFYSIDPLDGAAGVGGNLQMLGTPGYGVVFDVGQANCGPAAGCAGFYRRTDQTIWYDSPSFGGLTFGLYTTTTAFKTFGPGGTNPVIMGGGAKWVGSGLPLQVWGAVEMHDDIFGLNAITGVPGATGSDDQAIQVGVGYTLGDIFIFANYEMLEYESDGLAAGQVNKYERDAASVGVKWNLASGYVGAQFIMAQEGDCELQGGGACNANDSDAQMIGVGYFHTMSKQTQAYIMGTWLDNGDLASFSIAARSPNVNPGVDTLGVTIGLKHSF
jgi:predicted porin